MSLSYYNGLAYEHWKEFLPKRYKELLKAGQLPKALERAAKQTDVEMQNALDAGIPHDQAWEEIRGRYLLLEPEPLSPEDEDRIYGPNPNKEMLDLMQEIQEATQKIYDEM